MRLFKINWRVIPLVLFVFLGLFFWRGLSLNPHELPSTRIDKSLPEFSLPSLFEKQRSLTTNILKGKVSILNVWASWCNACLEEQAFLIKLARQGIVIYGFDYKDRNTDAKKYIASWGNPYKEIGTDVNGTVAMDLGVYGAPETFLIDSLGIIRYRHVGPLDENIWQQEFVPIIRKLEKV